ncbi:DUF2459 domain-containing protein [Nodosilinea sp. PGN35]|uniref:hypothetical protein n=1 Tax=Nodosilinea sp. PGN35 TaxID=3020489 RepID=UPI0023B313C8|nr:hypothetical protein [Nodosilinea sp. TSF1-S3]MDF0367193.1 hypothetical protein [Nodosilinea sp. TSF1-S3]
MKLPLCRQLVYLALGLTVALALTWFKVPATIIPPVAPFDRVTVHVVETGLHARLVLPLGDRWVQYGFGDWDYYALNRQDFYHAAKALILPTPGALGWGDIASLRQFRTVLEQHGGHFLSFDVSAAQTNRLTAVLRERIEGRGAGEYVYNPATNLTLAQDGQTYSLLHNSNHELATWLKMLHCRIDRLWLWREFRLASTRAAGGRFNQAINYGLKPDLDLSWGLLP